MASIQFTGLSSGLDTDSIVQAMLTTQQNKIDKVTNEQTKLEWKKEVWSDVNKKINDFYSNYVDKLRRQGTFESYTVSTNSFAIGIKNEGSLPVGKHTIEVTKLATEIHKTGSIDAKVTSKTETFESLGLLTSGQTATMSINGKNIEVSATDTVSSLENKIKAADESLNVNFDIKNKKLFISSKESGINAKINMSTITKDEDGNDVVDSTGLFTALGFVGADSICGSSGVVDETGTGAIYKYNGVELTAESNEVEINGLKITLYEENVGNPATIVVESDPDKVVDFVKEFVDAYNTLISDLNKMYDASNTSLNPLTDSEKESMSDKEIEEHEQTIKDSLLRRDSSLRTVIDTLRGTMQEIVSNNKYGSLASVGITTGSYTEKGKLYLHEDTLRAALEENPTAVRDLFAGSGDGTSEKTQGIATRLNSAFSTLKKRVEGLKSYDSYYNDRILTDQISNYKDKITTLQDRYKRMEEMYYKKFTAMETALATLNSQSSSFLSMLG